jgi:hypothetical protein
MHAPHSSYPQSGTSQVPRDRSFAGDRLVAFNMHPVSAETGPQLEGSREEYQEHLVLGLGYFSCSCIAPSPLERRECDNAPQPDVESALLEDLKMDNILVGPCLGEGVGLSPVRHARTTLHCTC